MLMNQKLTANRLLGALDEADRMAASPFLTREAMVSGHLFYEPGDTIQHLHFVESGVISIMTLLREGDAVECGMVGREGLLGAGPALAGLPTYTRAICQVSGSTLKIGLEDFLGLVATRPAFRHALFQYLEGLANQAQQSVACRAWHRAEARFCRWLVAACDQAGRDEIDLTQEFLAQMLAVQRTTVSQIAGEMQALGLIQQKRGRIAIIDRPGTEARACECLDASRARWNDVWPLPQK